MVHGRVLAREALADYDVLVAEHNRAYHQVSPFRSDYREVFDAIDADLVDKAAELAYAIEQWLDDDAWMIEQRDNAVSRLAWSA